MNATLATYCLGLHSWIMTINGIMHQFTMRPLKGCEGLLDYCPCSYCHLGSLFAQLCQQQGVEHKSPSLCLSLYLSVSFAVYMSVSLAVLCSAARASRRTAPGVSLTSSASPLRQTSWSPASVRGKFSPRTFRPCKGQDRTQQDGNGHFWVRYARHRHGTSAEM